MLWLLERNPWMGNGWQPDLDLERDHESPQYVISRIMKSFLWMKRMIEHHRNWARLMWNMKMYLFMFEIKKKICWHHASVQCPPHIDCYLQTRGCICLTSWIIWFYVKWSMYEEVIEWLNDKKLASWISYYWQRYNNQ